MHQTLTSDYVEKLDKQGQLKRNFDRPPIKDTISLSTGHFNFRVFINKFSVIRNITK